jgi:hypothetical protein
MEGKKAVHLSVFGFHVTTAIHDSRTSPRMVKYKVRQMRFHGKKPEAEVFPMTEPQEELIAHTVAKITEKEGLKIAAFNLCRDHMHLLLLCSREEVPGIMRRIKGRTARVCNQADEMAFAACLARRCAHTNKGINPLVPRACACARPCMCPPGYDRCSDVCDGSCADTRHCGCSKGAAGSASDAESNPATAVSHTSPNTMLKDGSRPFWTQKYGCKPIRSEKQLFNTIRYIQRNREKHRLPPNEALVSIIQSFVISPEDFRQSDETTITFGQQNI